MRDMRFAERRWHTSHVLERQPDGSLIARMQLSSLAEVKRRVMWWGMDREVLEPKELREMIAEETHEMRCRLQASDTRKLTSTIGSEGGPKGRRT
jgi:predicted DNA-binding transcriptional regulator YafY